MTRRIPLRDLVPHGPVLTEADREALLGSTRPSGVTYDGAAEVGFPVLPLQVFGVAYELDLVLSDAHPTWDMHEYARILTADGPVWLCKDTRQGSLDQVITADVDGLDHWLPEIPLPRNRAPVEVQDRSRDGWLDVELRYVDPDGAPVEVTFRGPRPGGRPASLRNNPSMGHGRHQVLVALDMPHRAPPVAASLTIGGERHPTQKIAGVLPIRAALVQTQAGLSTGRWRQDGEGPTSTTLHASGAHQRWTLHHHDGLTELVQADGRRTLRYVFLDVGGAHELVRAEVWPFGQDVPACVVHLSPALPDVGRRFRGVFVGAYVLDVNGQPSHATGSVRVRSDAGTARVDVQPERPRWTVDRPLTTSLRRQDGVVEAEVTLG